MYVGMYICTYTYRYMYIRIFEPKQLSHPPCTELRASAAFAPPRLLAHPGRVRGEGAWHRSSFHGSWTAS